MVRREGQTKCQPPHRRPRHEWGPCHHRSARRRRFFRRGRRLVACESQSSLAPVPSDAMRRTRSTRTTRTFDRTSGSCASHRMASLRPCRRRTRPVRRIRIPVGLIALAPVRPVQPVIDRALRDRDVARDAFGVNADLPSIAIAPIAPQRSDEARDRDARAAVRLRRGEAAIHRRRRHAQRHLFAYAAGDRLGDSARIVPAGCHAEQVARIPGQRDGRRHIDAVSAPDLRAEAPFPASGGFRRDRPVVAAREREHDQQDSAEPPHHRVLRRKPRAAIDARGTGG